MVSYYHCFFGFLRLVFVERPDAKNNDEDDDEGEEEFGEDRRQELDDFAEL